jgi:hypothetical protein
VIQFSKLAVSPVFGVASNVTTTDELESIYREYGPQQAQYLSVAEEPY